MKLMTFTSFSDRIFELLIKAWDKLPELALTFIVGYIIIKILKVIIRGVIRVSHTNAAMKEILLSIIDIGLWVLLLAALLTQIGLTQIAFALSGTVAIAGIAISVGAGAFVQDLVSGIFLAKDPDFNIGDRLKVDEVEGVVERMDARKIRLRDDKGKLHVIPNSILDKTAWIVIQKKTRGGL